MIGRVLAGRYELISVVADSGIFTAWSARDISTQKDVCVRMLKPEAGSSPDLLAALEETVERYSKITSPLIETVHRFAKDQDTAFLISDLTRGPNLADRVRKLAPFSVQVSVGMGVSLCRALEPLHRQKLAHGDINPGHCIVLANGDIRVQLAGFWQAYGETDSARRAVIPQMAPYIAPEIVEGGLPNPASDVYSIGTVLFELLTGRQPFYADSPVGVMHEHVRQEAPEVRSYNPSVPEALSQIVRKAMSKNPAARYLNAADLLKDLLLVQEALRFGKSLVWPLRAGEPESAVVEPGPVAPKMGAIRPEPTEESVKKRRYERDVPVWMLVSMTFLGAVLITLLGFYVMENLRRPRTVRVPDIKNLTVSEARNMLQKLNLELRIQEREANERVEVDRILAVSPAPGREVRERGIVNVVVSAGSTYVQMPDLKGETLDKARGILENLNLVPEPLTEQRASADVEFGRVLSTDPPARSKVLRNSRIKLVISAGSVASPTEIGKTYVYSLKVVVSGVTERTLVRVDISDIQGARTVYEASHAPDDVAEFEATGFGASATFRIYYDDLLVKEFEQNAQT